MAMFGFGVVFLMLWICVVIVIEERSGHGETPEGSKGSSPVSVTERQDNAASEAARLEREHEERLAGEAEAARVDQERQARLAGEAEAARVDQERLARLAADAQAVRPDQAPAASPAVDKVAVPPMQHPPAEQVTAQVAEITPGTPGAEYKLSAIMGGGGNNRAFLNNQMYQAGDRLGTGRILRIEAREVLIETAEGETVKLRVGESFNDSMDESP